VLTEWLGLRSLFALSALAALALAAALAELGDRHRPRRVTLLDQLGLDAIGVRVPPLTEQGFICAPVTSPDTPSDSTRPRS
jgi:hypothetical protein